MHCGTQEQSVILIRGNEMSKEKVIIELAYYLDAWLYCVQNGLNFKKSIRKKDFRTWQVVI